MRYHQGAAANELRAFQARQAGRVVENGRRVGRFGAAGIGRALGGNALRAKTIARCLCGGGDAGESGNDQEGQIFMFQVSLSLLYEIVFGTLSRASQAAPSCTFLAAVNSNSLTA